MNSKKPRDIKTKRGCQTESNSWSCRYRRQAAFYANRVTAPLKSCPIERGRKEQREKGKGREQQRRWSTATILIDNCCRCAKSVDPLGWVSMRWYRSTLSVIAPFTALACPFINPNNTLSVSAQGSTSIYAWSRQNFQLLIADLLLWPHGRRDVREGRGVYVFVGVERDACVYTDFRKGQCIPKLKSIE